MQQLTDFVMKYRTGVVVLTVLLAVGGLFSYITIPKEASPSIEIPIIVVTTVYPGVSPDDIESLITQRIENELQGLTGIKEIRSTSTEGVSTVIVEFNPDVSIDDAYPKVRDKVDQARPELPSDVEEPIVSEIDFSEFPIMTINLAANYPLAQLREVAEDLEKELEAIPSVLEVDLLGGLEREVQVNVRLTALQGYGLTFEDLTTAIRQENTTIPGGSVDVDRLNYLVRVSGEFDTPEEVQNLIVKVPEGSSVPIYVRDVADVVFGFKERATYARLKLFQEEGTDGALRALPAGEVQDLPVISLNVKQRSGENILATVERVQEKLSAFQLPSGTRTVITGDQSKFVKLLVKDMENNIISGVIFVVLGLLFFLGARTSLLVGIAIPVSMAISFIVFQAFGYTLNFIILFSIIIALGMLVDGAIVVVENIYRFREEGHERWEAARLGAAEVGGPVTSSLLTTIAAFVPMLMWPGVIGEFMSYMPITLIVTLMSSLFVALVINPVITGYLVRIESDPKAAMGRWAKRVAVGVLLFVALLIGLANWKTLIVIVVATAVVLVLNRLVLDRAVKHFAFKAFPKFVNLYRNVLSWMLERDYTVRRAMLRNTLTLTLFTAGALLALLGGLMMGLAGPVAGWGLLAPGLVLLVLGIAGIFVHTVEAMLIGRGGTVKAGLWLTGIFALLLGIIWLSDRPIDLPTTIKLMAFPLLIVLVGGLGWLFVRRGHLILTDNRSLLLNGTFGTLFAIVGLFAIAPTGVEFFPTVDPQQILVRLSLPIGTNLDTTNGTTQTAEGQIDALFAEHPAARANLKNVVTGVGTGGDALFGGGAASPNRSDLTLDMVDYEDRAESSALTLSRLREELQDLPGTELSIEQNSNGPPTGAPVNIEISGEDFDQIVAIANVIKDTLNLGVKTGLLPGLVDVRDNLNTGRPELSVHIDRERATQFGLSTAQIASTIRSAINGIEASKYRDGEDEYDITVRLREADRASLESLKNLTIDKDGQQIPLVSVADLRVESGLGSITRLDLQRVVTVQGSTASGFSGPTVLAAVQQYLGGFEQQIPPGYTMTYTGENEEQNESNAFLTQALLVAIGLIILILVAQFNSASVPLIIMIASVLSLIGVLLGLIITRTPFGLFTFIGIISLVGIVVNNAIVLLEYVIQLRERGLEKRAAIVNAGAIRLRPVLLGAVTNVIGLIPLTFGINIDFVSLLTDFDPQFALGSDNTQFWGPMGIAIISGLSFSMFLTLVIVPVMYSTFDSLSTRMGKALRSGDADARMPATTDGAALALPVLHGNGTVLVPGGDGAKETDVQV